MQEKRNTTMLIIITIAVFLVAVIGATFAYFATESEVGNAINANVGTAASMYSFSATSRDKIEMNIAFNEMSQANVSNAVLKSDNATIDVSLASPNNETATTCTYDIVLVWEDGDMYTTPDKALPFTEGGKEYNYEFSTTVDKTNETDLSKLPRVDKKVTLQSGVRIESNSTTPTVKTHDIAAYIYNLPVEQKNLFGKNFKAHVTIDNLSCNMESSEGPQETPLATTAEEGTLAYYINSVYNSQSNRASIATKQAGLYYHDASLENGAEDNTYRYAGGEYNYPKASEGYDSYESVLIFDSWNNDYTVQFYTLAYDETNTGYSETDAIAKAVSDGYLEEAVNNYVCFLGDDCTDANNLYRIISVDSTTNQTKVIKAKSIGNMVWNEKEVYTAKEGDEGLTAGEEYYNIWAITNGDGTYYTSSLNEQLNNEYLNSLSIKSKIVDTEWHVGGLTNSQMNTSTPQAIYGIEKADTWTYTAKVGLVYASEYGFAALPNVWTSALGYYQASKGKDWMQPRSEGFWTISRVSESSNTFAILDTVYELDKSGPILPSFTLSSDAKITNAGDGVGTKTNPMIIN